MKLEDLDLDFDFNVEPSGKGSKLKALKDMGVHNQEFDSLDDLSDWVSLPAMSWDATLQTNKQRL